MASHTTTITSAAIYRLHIIIILSFILLSTMSSAFDCTPEYGFYYVHNPVSVHLVSPNRKILMGVSNPKAVDSQRPNYDVELRNVPSGPDPLHHNDGPQKKPKISP